MRVCCADGSGCMRAQVVTGVGRHSAGGVARILPAVVRYLTEAGFAFSEEPHNPGALCVLLPGQPGAPGSSSMLRDLPA